MTRYALNLPAALMIASEERSVQEIAGDYDLTESQVQEALNFYQAHRSEIDAQIKAEAELEPMNE